ncbi:MAG: polysaccharide pyruvyl transferase family protein [Candidatus Levybacteria bacterium]|nr:polysaccharide pyruvyl transferase family protein [Candidatus Levybacteria bacterium]
MIDKYQKLSVFHFSSEIKKRHGKKHLKCIIFGNFGAMNLGDEAILAGQIQELHKIPNLTITVVGRYPKEVQRIHKVTALSLYSLYKVRREVKKSDFVIVGGGGIINKVERSLIGFFYQIYMLGVFFLLPRMYKKKIYVLGIGIYSNANRIIVNMVLPFLRAATLLTVRDFHSQTFLKKKNVHAALYQDNSFLMDLATKQDILKDAYFQKHYRPERMNIGISLVKPDAKKDEKRLSKEILSFIGEYYQKADFWFYATDYNPEYFNDAKVGKQLYDELKKQYTSEIVFHLVPMTLSPQRYFASFKLMQFVIAMRFHAAVFAYRNDVPFAGISYDKKCTSFIESVGKTALQLKTLTWEQINKNVL